MAGFKLITFGGFVPRVSPTLLQDNEATQALNCKLYSGSLFPWSGTHPVSPAVTVPAATKTIHRETDSSGDDVWFAWADDVDVVKGPLSDTQAFRFYYTGDGEPKKTNETLAGNPSGAEPDDYLSLGVPQPLQPTVTRVGSGSTGAEVRVYCVTTVSEFGDIVEESMPSSASAEVTVYSGDSVTVGALVTTGTYSQSGTTITITETAHGMITGDVARLDFTSGTASDGVYSITVVNANTYTVTASASASTSGNVSVIYKAPAGKYNLTKRRIYRSVTGTGATEFQFVAEVPITQASYSDTLTAAQLGEVLETTTWQMPPVLMQGLVELPNGMLAGFGGKEVYFSEPYSPHAWPREYTVSVEFDVVGLGVFGQSVVAVTEGNPYLISGIASASMSSEKISVIEPGVSKRTITSDANGVTYASPNGLMEIGPGGPNLITRNLMLKDEFSVYNPETALAKSTQSQYFMFYNSGETEPEQGALVFDRNLPSTPLSLVNIPTGAAWVDKASAALFVVNNDNQIVQWAADSFNRLPFEWTSKEFILNYPINLGAIEVFADYADLATANQLNAEIASIQSANQVLWAANTDLLGSFNSVPLNQWTVNGSILSPVPQILDPRFVLIIIYADGQEKARVSLTARGVKRLPAGFKSDNWQFKITGNIPLYHVKIAETVEGLKAL